jgi:hypothetical protein
MSSRVPGVTPVSPPFAETIHLQNVASKGPLPEIGSEMILPFSSYRPVKYASGTVTSTVIFFLSKSKLWTRTERYSSLLDDVSKCDAV